MFGSRRDKLEDRVARLERVMDQVLAELREMRGGAPSQGQGPQGPGSGSAPRPGSAAGDPTEEEPRSRDARGTPATAPPPSGAPGGPGPSPRRGTFADLAGFASGGTLLSRLGIALLILSVAFFFKYSIDQGWLTEWVRLALGMAGGVALAALGFRGAGNGEPLGTALAGGGIAVFFTTGFVGYQWFGLVSFPVAFGFLVAASGFGIYLALKSGRQTLAVVGLVGALATPLILTSPSPEVLGVAGYVCLLVASVAAIYLARGWRLVLVLAVVATWLALSPVVGIAARSPGPEMWGIQLCITFCALVFWLVPLARAALRAKDPKRWPRPDEGRPRWSVHLDALSLTMPMVAVLMSGWLWGMSRSDLGWAFLGGSVLAWVVGSAISRTPDPEGSAETQRLVSILLSIVGLGLVLPGDVLYPVFIAEAVALFAVGSRKDSSPLVAMGALVEAVVVGVFLVRMGSGHTLLDGDLSSLFDLAAVGGAAIIGTQLRRPDSRNGFFLGAYMGLLAWTTRELAPLEQAQALTSLAIGVEGTVLLVAGWVTNRTFLQQTGMATLLLVVAKVLLVDLAAVEPIWRVLLLFLFALLFLGLSKFTQGRRPPRGG